MELGNHTCSKSEILVPLQWNALTTTLGIPLHFTSGMHPKTPSPFSLVSTDRASKTDVPTKSGIVDHIF